APSEYNASFVGFLPSRKPAVAVIVMLDSPHGKGYTGGAVSAPIFRRIAESTLRYLGIGLTIDPEPPVIVARRDADSVQTGAGNQGQPIVSLVADEPPGMVPDLHGMSAREAVRKLTKLGLTVHLSGDGAVASQDPP